MPRSLVAELAAANRHLVILCDGRPPFVISPPRSDAILVCINRNTAEALIESGDLPDWILADHAEPALAATA
jgi:hypothetical protein